MAELDKIKKGLHQHCEGSLFDRCGECPYYEMDFGSWEESKFKCRDELMSDALELLKEQDAEGKWIYGEDETGVDGWHCSECSFFEPWFYDFDNDIDFIKRYEHCPKCGRKMTSYTGNQEGR